MKVPLIVTVGVVCLGVGVALGVVLMGAFGSSPYPHKEGAAAATQPGGGGPPAPGGPPSAAAPVEYRPQLAALADKLDLLTAKPLAVQLSAEQKKKLHDLLKVAGEKGQMSDDEAKEVVEAIQDLVKDDKEALEAAGYRWPGAPAQPPLPPSMAPYNPLKMPGHAEHWKALVDRLGKGD
jgi:hypothetical protein